MTSVTAAAVDDEAMDGDPAAGEPFPRVRGPRIVLMWILRLRWLAVIGQLAATLAAIVLGLNASLPAVVTVVAITAASNLGLWYWQRGRSIPTWLILAVLLVDMALLTALLFLTGGAENPFSVLYLVHVAMAVTTLGGLWTWIVVAAAAVFYASLLAVDPVPLAPDGRLPMYVRHAGSWASLVLIAGLIAYFSGRVNRSLRWREMHISALRERNARNEKLSTLTTLAAGAAHELGTPLATIALVAHELELAIAKMPGTDDLAEDAKLIRTECDRCRFILDRMRVDVASDPRSGRTELDELLAHLSTHLRDEERARLSTVGPLNGYAIGAPCPAIEQSLTVMIRNAMDADPTGNPVKLVISPGYDTIVFDVIDQGMGMTPDVLKRVGEPFFTTKEAGRGMGLGLFLVRLVADNYKGRFTIASRPKQGTQSTLELPMARTTAV